MAVWGPYGRMSSITLGLLTLDDAPVLAELLRVNRDFLTPWEPIRGEEYFTVDGQHANIRDALERHGHGSALPLAMLDDAARVIGLYLWVPKTFATWADSRGNASARDPVAGGPACARLCVR